MKVGHIFNEFCPSNGMFRYWPVVNPHVRSAVYCMRRTNAEMFPHNDVYVDLLTSRLRALPAGPWRFATRPLMGLTHRRSWNRFLNVARPDLLHVQFGNKAVRFLPMFQRAAQPLIVTFHGSDINCAPYSGEYCLELKRLFDRTTFCHFVSHDLREKAIKLGCPQEKARVIYLGAPPRQDVASCSYSDRIHDPHFYCVASLTPCKGHETLFEAFQEVLRKLPNARLDLLGDGPLRDRLEWLSSSLGIADSVTFHGHLEHEKALSVLASNADVVILASQKDDRGCEEGLPMSLQESGSLGLPCIGSRCGGIPELILHDETGYLIAQRDVDALSRAMLHLGGSPAERRRLGSAARERATKEFNQELFYKDIVRLYEEAISTPTSRSDTFMDSNQNTVTSTN